MAEPGMESDPLWQDLDWAAGQMLFMGWDSTDVTPQIRSLICEHHLGHIILTAKNVKSARQTARLVQELQTIARQAGHPHPLLIALDQENGGVNSLFDEDYICQFPSAMGVAAPASLELAYEVAKATAAEMEAVSVNMMLGPVLDVLTNARHQPLGVRSVGDNAQEVSQYGIAAMNGYKDGGVATCGKHFPSYGCLELGMSLDFSPTISQTLEELKISHLVPFRNAISTGRLDAVFVGGCGISNAGMNVTHACLSAQVVQDLLRNELGFGGVVISECLEMTSLIEDYGIKTGTVMAIQAGNDLVLLCRAYHVQLEAISGLKLGIENGMITSERVYASLERVLRLKRSCTSWPQALQPAALSLLSKMHPGHLVLSRRAYDRSITVVRDPEKLLPLSQSLQQHGELLLLTPLVKPLPASAATKSMLDKSATKTSGLHETWIHQERVAFMSGETVFRDLGRSIARARHGKLLHTSYTASGLRPVHENLIHRASAIIIVTADANRNLYQNGFAKHVAMLCHHSRVNGQKKPLILIAVSSPYDFAMDKSMGAHAYICTYDFTETAMASLVRALYGAFVPQGSMPGTMRESKRVATDRQQWLVENYEPARDEKRLDELLGTLTPLISPGPPYVTTTAHSFQLRNPSVQQSHLVVRNSSTQAIYGFAATYYTNGLGILAAIFVDHSKRNVSIGTSLHRRAMRTLLQNEGIQKVQLGTSYPGVFLGIPTATTTGDVTISSGSGSGSGSSSGSISSWFTNQGWDTQFPRRISTMVIAELSSWTVPDGLLRRMRGALLVLDLIHGLDKAGRVLQHVAAHAGPDVVELYKTALLEPKTCGVVRVRESDGGLLGPVLICSTGSPLATSIPALGATADSGVWGLVAPIVPAGPQATLILLSLAFMGLRQIKAQKASCAVLSWVSAEFEEPLAGMGFVVQQTFDRVTNTPGRFAGLLA